MTSHQSSAARNLLSEVLAEQPVFAITADIDWASEYCIETLLAACAAFSLKPTLFVTHSSPAIRAAEQAGAVEVGIHPNFLPGSSHGQDPRSVVDHVIALAPDARGSRSHCFASSSHILRALEQAGLDYDGGPLLFLEQGLTPLRHYSGILHLPVFWEDDVHWGVMPDWNFETVEDALAKPGLKIINVHPFFFALNIPNAAFYAECRDHIQTLDSHTARALRYSGRGCADFTMDLFARLGRETTYTMNAIAEWARKTPKWKKERENIRSWNSSVFPEQL